MSKRIKMTELVYWNSNEKMNGAVPDFLWAHRHQLHFFKNWIPNVPYSLSNFAFVK